MPLSAGIAAGAGSLKDPAQAVLLGYRVNLIPNPSFEVNTTGWYALTGASVATTTSEFNNGAQAAEVTLSSASGIQYGGAAADKIPYQGEGSHTASAYVKLATGATTANLSLRYYEYESQEATSTVSSGVLDLLQVSDTDGWVRLSGTYTKTGIANNVIIRIYNDSSTPGDVFYVDGVMLENSASLGDYFDGSIGGFWTGTAHQSFSGATPY